MKVDAEQQEERIDRCLKERSVDERLVSHGAAP